MSAPGLPKPENPSFSVIFETRNPVFFGAEPGFHYVVLLHECIVLGHKTLTILKIQLKNILEKKGGKFKKIWLQRRKYQKAIASLRAIINDVPGRMRAVIERKEAHLSN